MLAWQKSKGIPIGFEKTFYMEPMDFEECLWTKGIVEILQMVQLRNKKMICFIELDI